MTLFPLYNYFVFNGEIKEVSEFVPAENEGGIYEVLRVYKGVALFQDEHLNRFYNSAEIAQKEIPFSRQDIKNFILEIIRNNNKKSGNVLISSKKDLKLFFIPHNYPTAKMYAEGIECGILKGERTNPNAKIFQTRVRKKADEMISVYGYYEVLLLDKYNRITEGSRSNLFFIKENTLYTPPTHEVLPGITRQKILELAGHLQIDYIEKDVYIDDLKDFNAVFLTGTSPKVLPVKKIGRHQYAASGNILKKLMAAYDGLIEEYQENFTIN